MEDEDAPEPCLTKPSAAAASSEEVENLRRQVNKRDHIDMYEQFGFISQRPILVVRPTLRVCTVGGQIPNTFGF